MSEQMTDREPASIFIQWKGTNVCLDFHCFTCNTIAHFDGEFAYYLKCPMCGQHYAMPDVISLIAVPKPEYSCVQEPTGATKNLDEMGWEAKPARSVAYMGED